MNILLFIAVAIVGIGVMAASLWALAVQPAFWICLVLGALIYFGGWWVGVPALIITFLLVANWES